MGLYQDALILAPDLLANRPAVVAVPIGAIFCATDSTPANQLSRNNGASWDAYSPTGGGGASAVTAAGTLTNNALMIGQGSKAAATTTTGTGILTALGINVGSAGAPVVVNGAGGTPSSITLTNATGFPYATGGTGILPVANGGTGSSAGASIRRISVNLTNADIKALPTAGFNITVGGGAGTVIVPVYYLIQIRAAAGAYTNIHAAAYAVCQTASTAVQMSGYIANDVAESLTMMTDLFGVAGNQQIQLEPFFATSDPVGNVGTTLGLVQSIADINNQSVNFVVNNGGAGDFTGGNAANTGRIAMYYAIETI